ncbi:MAG: hypothetical protein J5933_00585 [Clostridia bacterium]|nr:hypothetical protein [Clostridia bacterium]
MDYGFYYGVISETGKTVWDDAELSPFDVLEKNIHIDLHASWLDAFGWARKNLRDEVQVDWGSFAWKCTGNDLLHLKEYKPDCDIEDQDEIVPDKEYGVVFIEMS